MNGFLAKGYTHGDSCLTTSWLGVVVPITILKGLNMKCAGHANNLKGAWSFHKSLVSRYDRNHIVESKGVLGDRESEGSLRQKFDGTYRNRIQGFMLWVVELRINKPNSHTEEHKVNPASQTERILAYPGRSLQLSKLIAE